MEINKILYNLTSVSSFESINEFFGEFDAK